MTRRVLIVSDDPTTASLIASIAAKADCEVHEATRDEDLRGREQLAEDDLLATCSGHRGPADDPNRQVCYLLAGHRGFCSDVHGTIFAPDDSPRRVTVGFPPSDLEGLAAREAGMPPGAMTRCGSPATPPHTQQTAGGTGAGEAAGSAPAMHPGSRWPSGLADIAAAVLSAPSPVNIWAKVPAGVWHLATETYPDEARVSCTGERVPAGTFQAVPRHHDLGVLAQVDGAPWRAAVCSICQSIARGLLAPGKEG